MQRHPGHGQAVHPPSGKLPGCKVDYLQSGELNSPSSREIIRRCHAGENWESLSRGKRYLPSMAFQGIYTSKALAAINKTYSDVMDLTAPAMEQAEATQAPSSPPPLFWLIKYHNTVNILL